MKKRILKVLIACEESQAVCKAFRELGHDAYSNDIIECSGGHPEWHLQMDALEAIKLKDWDLMIAHPPCTYLSKAGARWLYSKGELNMDRHEKGQEAGRFLYTLRHAYHINPFIKHICVENPVPMNIFAPYTHSQRPPQIIQPYEYGEPYSKKTLLWLYGLPDLEPTNILKEYKPYLPSNTGGKKKGQKYHYTSITQKHSSKTFPGIAKAMADQWSKYILGQDD